jgi:hypothetical protein
MWSRSLSSDVSEIDLVFSIPPHRPIPNIAPSWNVAPTDPVPVVRYNAKTSERSLDVMRSSTHQSYRLYEAAPAPERLTEGRLPFDPLGFGVDVRETDFDGPASFHPRETSQACVGR